MPKMFQAYGLGQALLSVLPPPIPFEDAPTSSQDNYEIGQVAFTPPKNPTAFYIYGGAGNWVKFTDSDGAVTSVVGTANQVTVTTVDGTATVSLPAAITAPGSLTTTTTLAATTTVTAGTGITATTGNIVATAGQVNAGTSMTAGTTLTATLGNITATNGNIVRGTAGNKDVYSSVATNATAGANSAGTVTLVGGTVTVATTAVTANSLIRLSRQSVGSTGAQAMGFLTVGTITPGVSFVINAWDVTDATNLMTTDVSVVFWEIVN